MSYKEKCASKIVFVIDNNYYLVSDNKIKLILKNIRNKYKKYMDNSDVMALNWFKIKTAFFNEIKYLNVNKEKRSILNILDVMKDIINNKNEDEFFNILESDINLLNNYLYFNF